MAPAPLLWICAQLHFSRPAVRSFHLHSARRILALTNAGSTNGCAQRRLRHRRHGTGLCCNNSEDLLWVYTESLNVYGKAHTRYLQMVGTDPDTAIAAAKEMLYMSVNPVDFYLDRLDLAAEAVVVKPKYNELFT